MRISLLAQVKQHVNKKTPSSHSELVCLVCFCLSSSDKKFTGITLGILIKMVHVLSLFVFCRQFALYYVNLVPARDAGNILGTHSNILCEALGCYENALGQRPYLKFKHARVLYFGNMIHNRQCSQEMVSVCLVTFFFDLCFGKDHIGMCSSKCCSILLILRGAYV